MSSLAIDLSLVEPPSLYSDSDELLFELIAQDLSEKGYSIQKNALSTELSRDIYQYIQTKHNANEFKKAGIGRGQTRLLNSAIRSDEISWIVPGDNIADQWLDWAESLKQSLNRRLFLGLNGLESHFAHYSPGDFYKTHVDAFKGQSNRKLSLVSYFNPHWKAEDGGELVIYTQQAHQPAVQVEPEAGTIVIFLSEEFPHEVLPATKDRFSIATWFRINEFNPQIL